MHEPEPDTAVPFDDQPQEGNANPTLDEAVEVAKELLADLSCEIWLHSGAMMTTVGYYIAKYAWLARWWKDEWMDHPDAIWNINPLDDAEVTPSADLS
jgi:hypothetical protein